MMTRKITIIALIAGIVLGTAATEGFNVYRQSQDSYRQSHDSRIFQERLHCKAVADAYVKENTDLNDNSVTGRGVTLEKVDYSPARNSCVAELETVYFAPRVATEFENVQDLLSGETLFSVSSTDEHFDAFRPIFLPRVWDYVINNASKPLELEKEWVLMESKYPPKSAPPSGIKDKWDQYIVPTSKRPQLDPSTGEPISYDAQGNPITEHHPKSAPSSGR
jgi:hypothetical protein